MSLKIGDRIDGKYEIKRLLGEGGMGAVYEGENTLIHRRVAIKVLHSGVAAMEEAVKRFEREAQAAGRIGSEHIVEVLDLGRLESGDLYMVMEFLKGESLSSRIKSRGRLAPRELCAIGVQLLDGLSAAHEAGIIHRDLKPDNVFLIAQSKGRTDFVKILDFGISKFNGLNKDFSMTRTGSVMGTPYYMAPEQARGAKNLDARLDVYAAGVILFEAATGRVPFDGDTFNELLIKIVTEDAPPVRQLAPDLDPALADIIDKARQKNPDQRFASAREFRDAVAGWVEGASSAIGTGATLPLQAASPVVAGADTALVGGAGLAAREVIPANAAAVVAVPISATVPLGSPGEAPALGNRTGQAWTNTQAALPPEEPRKRSGRNAMLAGGAAVVLACLALVFKLQSDTASSARQAAATSASVERQLQEAREEAASKLEEERARSRELEAREEARRVEMERAQATAQQERASADEARRREEEAKAKELEAQRKRAAARPPAPSRSTASAAGKRRIRTDL
jgi:eukaryotic-like serine/threonine-protein kinase